jgi:multidrug efflux pump subunit AcrA (membrane-fusion protein)
MSTARGCADLLWERDSSIASQISAPPRTPKQAKDHEESLEQPHWSELDHGRDDAASEAEETELHSNKPPQSKSPSKGLQELLKKGLEDEPEATSRKEPNKPSSKEEQHVLPHHKQIRKLHQQLHAQANMALMQCECTAATCPLIGAGCTSVRTARALALKLKTTADMQKLLEEGDEICAEVQQRARRQQQQLRAQKPSAKEQRRQRQVDELRQCLKLVVELVPPPGEQHKRGRGAKANSAGTMTEPHWFVLDGLVSTHDLENCLSQVLLEKHNLGSAELASILQAAVAAALEKGNFEPPQQAYASLRSVQTGHCLQVRGIPSVHTTLLPAALASDVLQLLCSQTSDLPLESDAKTLVDSIMAGWRSAKVGCQPMNLATIKSLAQQRCLALPIDIAKIRLPDLASGMWQQGPTK